MLPTKRKHVKQTMCCVCFGVCICMRVVYLCIYICVCVCVYSCVRALLDGHPVFVPFPTIVLLFYANCNKLDENCTETGSPSQRVCVCIHERVLV